MTADQVPDAIAIDAWLQDELKAAGIPLAARLSVEPSEEFGLRQAEGYPPPPPPSTWFAVSTDLPLGADAEAVAQRLKGATNANPTLKDHLPVGKTASCAKAGSREDGVQPRVELDITIAG